MVICFERNCNVLLGRDYDNRLLRSQQERNNIDPGSVELVADETLKEDPVSKYFATVNNHNYMYHLH